MDYEKKYKEAFGRAMKLCEQGTITESLGHIFPELKESEDERIRKGIIYVLEQEWVHLVSAKGVTKKEMIGWLEKQGEQKPTLPKWKYKKDHTPLLRDSIILNKYGCVAKSPSGAIVSDVWVLNYDELAKLPKEEIEKQGEQKPADKVETKFKVCDSIKTTNEETLTITKIDDKGYWSEDLFICGFDDAAKWELVEQKSDDKVKPKFHEDDWISGYYINFKVTAINSKGYVVEDTEGNKINILFENEKFHHLFTIDDAKDGDVLINWNNTTFIFKDVEDETVKFHIAYNEKWDAIKTPSTKLSHLGLPEPQFEFHPATKEQRDTLFAKMHEAGYMWDSESKQLLFLKAEPRDTQNPAWSEEDEHNIQNIDSVLFYDKTLPEDTCVKLRDFLKSLKERIGG